MSGAPPHSPAIGQKTYIELSQSRSQKNSDDEVLRRLGKKPVLRRTFGLVSMIGFACSLMITWEGVLLLLAINFNNGGYAGSVYCYIIVWIGTLATFATMGELSSMAPTAGGQYHWVSILGPKPWRKFLSYVIGWLTVMGWQAAFASTCFLASSLIQGLIVLNDPAYVPQPWQLVLLYWANVTLAIVVNTYVSRILPKIETFILFLHVFGFIAILIPLVYFAPHGNASDVFTLFLNEGAWPTQGLSFMVGIVGPVFSLLGADGAVHMSEEVSKPAVNVPVAMVYGIGLNGALGFAMLLATLFSLGDADSVFTTSTGYPFMAIFLQAVGSVNGAMTMAAIITIMDISTSISIAATASRMSWSFARDRGLPGWRWLGSIEKKSSLPVWSIVMTAVFSVLLSLIAFGSSVAFNDVVSLTISGLYTSYLIGNSLLLYRRIRGDIKQYAEADGILRNTMDSEVLTWGVWKIPEPLGTIINAFSCVYLTTVLIFSYWPTTVDPGPAGMNYSSLMTGGVAIISLAYYYSWGRRAYTGPVIEVGI